MLCNSALINNLLYSTQQIYDEGMDFPMKKMCQENIE